MVRAVDRDGRTSASSSIAWAQTLDTSPPSAPSGSAAVARSARTAEITLGPSTDDAGVVGYEVFRAGVRVATLKVTAFRGRAS